MLAYSLSTAGPTGRSGASGEIDTGADRPDVLKWSKFSGPSWTHDGSGFFYSRYDEPTEATRWSRRTTTRSSANHRLGTPQSRRPARLRAEGSEVVGFSGSVTDDGRLSDHHRQRRGRTRRTGFLQGPEGGDGKIVSCSTTSRLLRLHGKTTGRPLSGSRPIFQAPLGRVIEIDVTSPGGITGMEIIPQSNETLRGVNVLNDTSSRATSKDADRQVKVFGLDGRFLRENPPASVRRGVRREEIETDTSTPSRATRPLPRKTATTRPRTRALSSSDPGLNSIPTTTRRSRSSTPARTAPAVPSSFELAQGLTRDGSHPTYLYALRRVRHLRDAGISVSNLVWMEMGGVLAVDEPPPGAASTARSGTSLGRSSGSRTSSTIHRGGGWLIAAGTPRRRSSRSAGAATAGPHRRLPQPAPRSLRCRPPRRRRHGHAPLPQVHDRLGVDVRLRLLENPDEFKALYAYSPLHKRQAGYGLPSDLINDADHDDRVVPAHSFSTRRRLQAAQTGPRRS